MPDFNQTPCVIFLVNIPSIYISKEKNTNRTVENNYNSLEKSQALFYGEYGCVLLTCSCNINMSPT